jgi:hypothetical protein
MRRSKIAGMTKYGTMKEALRAIKEDTVKQHDKFLKSFQESLNGGRKKETSTVR